MNILGISAFYHDSAASLVRDGEIISACQEERFSRKKHDYTFPVNAINWCLQNSKLIGKDLDYVAFYDKPFLKFERILETYLAFAPFGIRSFVKAIPLWIKQKIWIKELIHKETGFNKDIIFPEHHESHAASAFFPSPFKEAAFLTIDGVGEWTTASYGVGKDNKIKIISEIKFPHSLGLLYSAFTYYLGFKVNSGEYKVMGLAPYGESRYKDLILTKLIDLKKDGSFKLNMDYFNYGTGLTMTNKKFDELFKGPPRKPESEITRKHMDIAHSIQEVIQEVMLKMAKYVYQQTKLKFLCLAGGVALNCVGNGAILREGPFEDIWIQPAAGDAGGAVGAALFTWYHFLDNKRVVNGKSDSMKAAYLGPEFKNEDIVKVLKEKGASYLELKKEEIPQRISDLIAQGKVIGWFEGKMEFGPRALGNRSILGDARSHEMQKKINLKVKFRESFRPFAPSVIEEKISDYFEIEHRSPYMLLVAPVKESLKRQLSRKEEEALGLEKLNIARSKIPAITHVDYSARIQSVSKEDNTLFYELLKDFGERYDYPVIINTSFNVREEPIVCTPLDAYNCFMQTGMDYLVIGNFLLDKKEQKTSLTNNDKEKFLAKKENSELIEELKNISSSKEEIRRFAFTLGAVSFILTMVFFWSKNTFLPWLPFVGITFIGLGIATPIILKPIYKTCMSLAIIIGWSLSNLILAILFYLILTPLGTVAKLARRDFLNLKPNPSLESYWQPKKSGDFNRSSYKRQF